MRSDSKDIYGVNVLPLIAIIHQVRRWWTIRKLCNRWNESRRDLVFYRELPYLSHRAKYFQVQQRYKHMRQYVKVHQQRGDI